MYIELESNRLSLRKGRGILDKKGEQVLRSSDLCGGSKRLIGQDKTSRVNNLALNLKEFGTVQKLKELNIFPMKE